MTTSQVYKIKDKETNLFSTGGRYPRWTKSGKAWPDLKSLKCHLNFFVSKGTSGKHASIPHSWEVIVYDVLVNPSHGLSAKQLMEEHEKSKK